MVSWNGLLAKKVGLVSGVANEHSIAAGCAQAFHEAGAELVLTCREKSMPFVTPVAKAIESRLLLPLDVETPGSLESVFAHIRSTFGRLDFVLHSIAFCPKQDLHGRVTDCSEGFARAMDISVHSFIRMARLAEPMMPAGGCLCGWSLSQMSALSPWASSAISLAMSPVASRTSMLDIM